VLKGDLLKHKRKRKRKSIKIEDSKQSEQIMLNKEYISDSMKCENQEPVEVVLVFNERKRQVFHIQHLTQRGIFSALQKKPGAGLFTECAPGFLSRCFVNNISNPANQPAPGIFSSR
jgi:hypothetical protein